MPAAQLASSFPAGLPAIIAGRYHVVCPLGKGGMAQVLRVTDGSAGRPLALKLLASDASATAAALFELEYQTLASMQHPCVVRVFEFGRAAEGAFYTMELLEGEDLSQLAPVSWREACGYLRDAALALTLLHARGLVHRDVSPRNLWRCSDGRVKLIDFGAVAPFGRVAHVIGTPPCVAPEVLRAREVDHHTDLYALGAVAYFLLTRVHAFPARDLSELPALWEEPPAPPSARVAELARVDLEPVPPELDALVLALLSARPLERPGSVADVIDRIDLMPGSSVRKSEGQRELVGAHLSSSAYVGQARARTRLSRLLALAVRGRGQRCIVHGEAGSGRSRLLRELAIDARFKANAVLHVRAREVGSQPLALAAALATQLLDSLPELARAAAAPHAATLGNLSPAVHARLGLSGTAATPEPTNELMLEVQQALCDWFVAMAERHAIVVLVDDGDQADEGSLAGLLLLAEALREKRVLLVLALTDERRQAPRPVEQALCARGRAVQLVPLHEAEVAALLRSVFGPAANLARLAASAFGATRGNPGHVIALCEQLVARGLIGYAEGSWLLPQKLPVELSSASREQALIARLDLLDAPTRALARVLSIQDALPLELAQDLARPELGVSLASLRGLLQAGVCVAVADHVRFAHETVRRALLAELAEAPDQKRMVHRVLGEFLLVRAETTVDRIRAGAHLVHGDDARGVALVSLGCQHVAIRDPDIGKLVIEEVEAVTACLQARGCPARQLAPMLAVLAEAGYVVHPRYAVQYGERTVTTLEELVGLGRARRLRPYLGGILSLLVGLLIGGLTLARHFFEPGSVRPKEAMMLLFAIVPTLVGTSALCTDADTAHRYASVLAPFAVFWRSHPASFLHALCLALADTARDPYSTRKRWHALLARFESISLPGATPSMEDRIEMTILQALSVSEIDRDSGTALELADRAERLHLAFANLFAEQARAMYYANQGKFALYERHRARAEQLGIQLGSSWQAEMWAVPVGIHIAFRMHDAMALKAAFEQAERLSQEVPSFARYARLARAAYLSRRGRFTEALSLSEGVLRDPPHAFPDWTKALCSLAQIHNDMGQYQRTLEVCQVADTYFNEADREDGLVGLFIERERAIAQGGLGDPRGARAKLRALIDARGPNASALALGELHDAALTVSLMGGDEAAARHHLEAMERLYAASGAASLAQYCARRRRALAAPGRVADRTGSEDALTQSRSAQMTGATVERMLAGGALTLEQRAHRALQILSESTRARHGSLFLLGPGGALRLVASLGRVPTEASLLAWLQKRVAHEVGDESTQMVGHTQVLDETNTDLREHGAFHHRALVLASSQGVPIGVALLSREARGPDACPEEIVAAVAQSLRRVLTRESVHSVDPS